MESTDGCISDKYLEHEEVNKYEKGRPLEFFKDVFKNQKKISAECAMLDNITMTDDHEDALIPHEKGVTAHLNRYCDILPYKHSVVTLNQENDANGNEYINANYIPGPFGEKKEFIGCQGPKANTVKDFWRMVQQQNVSLILMLCRLTEGGRSKCEQYWPIQGETTKYDDINLHVKCEDEKHETSYLSQRDFVLINPETNEEISKVTQIQYLGWPDHGIPEKDELEDFDTLVRHTMKEYNRINEENSDDKILYHCSAGIGRTGTLLSIIHIIANLEKQMKEEKEIKTISVFSTLRKLREHRYHLVQTGVQYFFIYDYLSLYLKKMKLI